MKPRVFILWAGLALTLLFVNFLAYQREGLAANGRVVLLELAPVDPRSLIQGDYMMLRYALSQEIRDRTDAPRGYVVVRLDANSVAHYVRIYDPSESLAADELILPFREHNFDVRVGPNSFFFQEGYAVYYENAEYGELRASEDGRILLVGLRDENFDQLAPPE
jgi:uncharacterized membrane-anchored protein